MRTLRAHRWDRRRARGRRVRPAVSARGPARGRAPAGPRRLRDRRVLGRGAVAVPGQLRLPGPAPRLCARRADERFAHEECALFCGEGGVCGEGEGYEEL